MNGSENSYASALFFALVSLGAVIKIDDVILGGVIGAVGAFLAAINFRRALNKSAQAKEEDHQRMEIQLQQLRSKIIETSNVNITAMNSLNDAAQLLKDNLEKISIGLSGFNKFSGLAKSVETISVSVANLEKNFSAFNNGLEKISAVAEVQKNPISAEDFKNFVEIEARKNPLTAEDFKNLITIEEAVKKNSQTALKILHFIAQSIGNPSYTQEFEKINLSFEKLIERVNVFDELKTSATDTQKNLFALVRIAGGLSKDFTRALDVAQKNLSEPVKNNNEILKEFTQSLGDAQKNLAEPIKINSELLKNFTRALDDTQKNLSDLIKINNELSKSFTTNFGDTQRNLSALVKTNNDLSKDFTTNFDDLRLDVARFSDKLDSIIDSANKSPLTEEDVDLLKRIMAKINKK